MFGVCENYVYKLQALWRWEGDLTPRPHGGGATLKTNDALVRTLSKAMSSRDCSTFFRDATPFAASP
jgi:hypothetical protein